MNMIDLIYKKREGKELKQEEISYLIKNYVRDKIPDYQVAAWAMAVYFQGMSEEEMTYLTREMTESGDRIKFNSISNMIVDKHSTGGVGDTTTLVLAPLISSVGIPVAKMSGKGLGHTGGTIDKLQSIPGLQTELTKEVFMNNVGKYGIAISGQTGNLAPADKKLYSLRDVTATVESIPLIASSIMSKKLAGGAQGILLDVKVGKGAFMEEISEAEKLAEAMVSIGRRADKEVSAVISDMNQPLGRAVGNSLEVIEAINTLKGEGPADLTKLSLELGSRMLLLSEKYDKYEKAYQILENKIKTGAALEKFKQFIKAQQGKEEIIEDYSLLPQAENKVEIKSEKEGYIQKLNSRRIGLTAMRMGAGRETKNDKINPAVGIELNKKYGDYVNENEVLAYVYINNKNELDNISKSIKSAYKIGVNKPSARDLIIEIID